MADEGNNRNCVAYGEVQAFVSVRDFNAILTGNGR